MQAMKLALAMLCLSAVAANADGLPYSVKDTAAVRPVTCYIKAYGAGEFINNTTNLAGASLDLGANGMAIGGGVGCDITQGKFLAGLFGDYTWNKANSDIKVGGVSALSVPFGSEWSVGARAGVFATPSTLLYGLVAYTAAQDRNVTMVGVPFGLGGPKGVTLGGGVETAMTKNLVFTLEYRHTAFDTNTTAVLPMTFDTVENTVRAGLAYRF